MLMQDEYHCKRSENIIFDLPFLWYLFHFTSAVLLLFLCLIVASLVIMEGQPLFLQASFVSIITLADLTPNVGVFWYLFIEIFDRYRAIFTIFFHAHVMFYPLALHFRVGCHYPIGPWTHCIAAAAMITLFKSYPTAGDFALMFSLMLIQFELVREAQSRTMFALSLVGLIVVLSFFPAMLHVWLNRNAGNANFLFNMTLGIGFFGGQLLVEWLKAGIRLRKRMRASAFCRNIVLDIIAGIEDKSSSTLNGAAASATDSAFNGMEDTWKTHCDADLRQRVAPSVEQLE